MKRWLDDYEVGESLMSHGRTLSEADFLMYAGIEHDFASIHFDAEMMEGTRFERRIGAGFITLNLAVGLFGQGDWDWYWPEGAIKTEGWRGVRFQNPTFIGDTLRCRRTIASVEATDSDSGVLMHDVEVFKERDQLVMVGKELIRVKRRPARAT